MFWTVFVALALWQVIAQESSPFSGAQAAPRSIHFKLPIDQTTYHWTFDDRTAFLAGTLILDIVREDKRERMTVFENGNIGEGWEESSLPSDESCSHIYFGFVSREKFSIASADRVEMTLSVPEGLQGGWRDRKGILPAGEYRASNKATVYVTSEERAFLRKEDWKPTWDVVLTDESGRKSE